MSILASALKKLKVSRTICYILHCVSFCNTPLCVCIENKIKIDSATCPVVAMFDFKKLNIVTTGSLASVNVHRSTEFHVERSNG